MAFCMCCYVIVYNDEFLVTTNVTHSHDVIVALHDDVYMHYCRWSNNTSITYEVD